MKTTIAMLALFLGLGLGVTLVEKVNAEDVAWSVKVTSFLPIVNSQTRLGELCGVVTGPANELSNARVSVASDPKAKKPGYYAVAVDRTGRFCVVVHTFTGTAEVAVEAPTATKPNPQPQPAPSTLAILESELEAVVD